MSVSSSVRFGLLALVLSIAATANGWAYGMPWLADLWKGTYLRQVLEERLPNAQAEKHLFQCGQPWPVVNYFVVGSDGRRFLDAEYDAGGVTRGEINVYQPNGATRLSVSVWGLMQMDGPEPEYSSDHDSRTPHFGVWNRSVEISNFCTGGRTRFETTMTHGKGDIFLTELNGKPVRPPTVVTMQDVMKAIAEAVDETVAGLSLPGQAVPAK